MMRLPSRSTRIGTLFPDPTRFRSQLLQVVTDLYHLRDHLPDGGLGFEPWAGRAAARVAGYRHVRENRTPRMPEEIVTPLLAGSLRYITTFATDILARSEEHTSELQSLMRISYAVFCLQKQQKHETTSHLH